MWKRTLIVFLLLFMSGVAFSQNADPVALANEYYFQGDYEKAQEEYEKLLRNKRNIPMVHDNYLNLLIREKQFDLAEKHVKKAIQAFPNNFTYEVDLGVVLIAKGEEESAKERFEEVINRVAEESANESNANKIRILAQHFYAKNLRPYAMETYVQGRARLGRPDLYSLELANVYRVLNEKQNMIKEYLNFAKAQPGNLNYVKNSFQRLLIESVDLNTLEITLYDYIQTEAGNPIYNDILVWTHLQQKNFSAALRQARALDRRVQNEGRNIINVGMISYRNGDYRTADKAFGYIIDEFPESPNVRLASRYALLAREEVLKATYPVDTVAIKDLIVDYESYRKSSRDIVSAMEAQRRVALLYAFQLNQIDSAIVTLNELIRQPVGKQRIIAEAKMDLADIFLLDEQPWESILLYGQVEREFKDEPLGYTAKLKSAKLSYFKGEFELAQGHLDILKLATSREIANDALDLSILIKNNTVFDSTDVAMKRYASIELMLFQNQKREALQAIDSMLVEFDGHSLSDELLFLKAQTDRELGNFEEALAALEQINTKYYYDILGDDAFFMAAQVLDCDLNLTEEAMKRYDELLIKFPGSIYVAESRQRFRELRGDFNN